MDTRQQTKPILCQHCRRPRCGKKRRMLPNLLPARNAPDVTAFWIGPSHKGPEQVNGESVLGGFAAGSDLGGSNLSVRFTSSTRMPREKRRGDQINLSR